MAPDTPYPRTPLVDLDLDGLRTYSLEERPGKVTVQQCGHLAPTGATMGQWLQSLPDTLAVRDLRRAARAIRSARREGRGVLLGMGAHPVKVGLGPVIAQAIADGVLTGIATNGAAIVHDYELALTGRTSEDVDTVLQEGTFGMAEETSAHLNSAITRGSRTGDGIGRSVGKLIAEGTLPWAGGSIFAAAWTHSIPATVHVALGTDIIHMHPSCDWEATGKAAREDFRLFTRQVAALEEGVFINLGSAVIIPEVFLKACSIALNLGHTLRDLTTLNMDFLQHYRPRVNVVQRATGPAGHGISLTGHHEILFPLLMAAVREDG